VNDEPIILNRDFFADPHASYRRLPPGKPVHRAFAYRGLPVWLVTGYDEARQLLADPRLSKDSARALDLFPAGTAGSHATALAAHMLNSDPPDHTRLRKLVTRAFTSRTISRLRPRIQTITEHLLDQITSGDDVDLLDALAFPLAIAVIGELLGVPCSDRAMFRTWTDSFLTAASDEEVAATQERASRYLTGLIAEKRAAPAEDLLSELVRVSDQGDRLSEAEVVTMAFLLVAAGYETTVNLIGNGVLALLGDPRQLAALRADPGLVPAAVEEFLRFDGPVDIATVRFATQTVRIAGAEIQADEFVLISLLAANRDGGRFPQPDQLDITRDTGGHLAFGHGIHYCLGAPLARLEAEIALVALLSRFQRLELAADPAGLRWRKSHLIHGLHALPVRLGRDLVRCGAKAADI
jgi:cytochrome P450